MRFPDDSVYDGNWENNKMSGAGIIAYKDGRRYAGEWKDN